MTFNDATFNEFDVVMWKCVSSIIFNIIFFFFFIRNHLKFIFLFYLIYSSNVMEKVSMYVWYGYSGFVFLY